MYYKKKSLLGRFRVYRDLGEGGNLRFVGTLYPDGSFIASDLGQLAVLDKTYEKLAPNERQALGMRDYGL